MPISLFPDWSSFARIFTVIKILETTRQATGAQLYLTEAGERLFKETPLTLTHFTQTATFESRYPQDTPQDLLLGQGQDARVVLLPEHEGLCVKISGPETGERFQERDEPAQPKNLITEMYFMDKVRSLMLSKDCGIHVPRLYAACRVPGGSTALLQDRLPADLAPLGIAKDIDGKLYRRISWAVSRRVNLAFGDSLLRTGVGDFDMHEDAVHVDNVWLEPTHDSRVLDPEGKIYLIDLIGRRTIRAALLAQTPRRLLPRMLRR